jgi:transglutaminase-like putative cysteine protease
MTENDMDEYLRPGAYIDSDHPSVVEFAARMAGDADDKLDRALALYAAVRDGIRYDPYIDYGDAANFRASGVLAAGQGFCIGKAALLAACCRAVGIPARVGYADVRNHMTSRRLHALIQTDVFLWHSYAELHLAGKWVKATPAFDAALCARIGIPPLEFDGASDSLFQPCDPDGRRRMQYLAYRGAFADVPFERIQSEFHARYPGLMAATKIGGDFRAEATTPVQV